MSSSGELETDFLDSWTEVEVYFKDLSTADNYEFTRPVVEIIAYLRGKHFDRKFRAGKSMWILFLSRSKHWGLRDDQHSIGIEPIPNNKFKVFYSDGEEIFSSFETSTLKDNIQFESMLIDLTKQPIN